MPTRLTGTDPVSEWDAGVPANPTPAPTKAYPSPTTQYGELSPQSSSMVRKPRTTKTYPTSSVNREPCDSTSLADRGAMITMKTTAGRIAAPASSVS